MPPASGSLGPSAPGGATHHARAAACLGELVRIAGSDHAWFEDRGRCCTLLVYVDDATSRLVELCFADTEPTFDYFHTTRPYLDRHGKPMAFYSDRLSVFHVQARRAAPGFSQFGRGLHALNIAARRGPLWRCRLTIQSTSRHHDQSRSTRLARGLSS